ncbi:extracellular solute-binding protein [Nesterenkonia xinjiangensis]|uniref:Multiple sugar transport system substrate-binding protein n=1 Tax=Nesterenkonia xinjiangensis TaxID=225327 RepID=A0A7Z0K8L1_9MICC|nr:extracellular solute-binding protein [Nesterenkonia xinjiangensis]NYJ77764.1 multiple sugar transport system substrate-binding protein [Nesterenkonia xinjiangensis]
MTSFSRRQLLRGGLGLGAGAMALAGCAVPGTTSVNAEPTIPAAGVGETVTLTCWAWLKDLQIVADIWNEQNPHIQVEIAWIPGGNDGGYQKLYSALAAGAGPDLAQVELRSIPEFMMVNGLVDLRRYGVDQHADRFDPTLWGQVSFADGVYGIPQDSGPTAMYYRPDHFDEVGAEPPATWEEWADIAAEIRQTGRYMDAFPLADTSVFAAHAMQAGATWFQAEEDGWVIDMAGESTLEVARFFDGVVDADLVTTQNQAFSPGWFAAAADDQIASLVSASWGDALLAGVSGAEGQWRVAPLPTWPTGHGSSHLGGSSTAVLANSAHPQEAMEFAVWLNSSAEGIDGLIENSGIGWSTNPDHIGTPREGSSEFFGGQSYNTEIFEPAAADQNPDWQWWPTTQQTFNILADEFRRKAGGASLVDAVVRAEAATIEVFRNKGLTVRRAQR